MTIKPLLPRQRNRNRPPHGVPGGDGINHGGSFTSTNKTVRLREVSPASVMRTVLIAVISLTAVMTSFIHALADEAPSKLPRMSATSLAHVMPALPLKDGITDTGGGHSDLAWYTDVTGTKPDGTNEDLRFSAPRTPRSNDNSWTLTDTLMEVAVIVALDIDRYQTLQRNKEKWEELGIERNFIGAYPTNGATNVYFAGAALFHVGVAVIMPRNLEVLGVNVPARLIWQSTWFAVEAGTIQSNYRFGISIGI